MTDISNFLVDPLKIINNQAGYGDATRSSVPTEPSKFERQPQGGDQLQLSDVRTSEFAPNTKKSNYASESPLAGIIDHFGVNKKVSAETPSVAVVSNVEGVRQSLFGSDELDVTKLGMPVFEDPIDPATEEVEIRIPGNEAPSTIQTASVEEIKPKAVTKEERITKIINRAYDNYNQTGDIHKAEELLGKDLRSYETKHLHGGELIPGHGFDDSTVKIVQAHAQKQQPKNAKEAKFWGHISEKFNPDIHPRVLCNNTKRFDGTRAKARSLGKSEQLKETFMQMYKEFASEPSKFTSRDQGYIMLAKRYYSVAKRI